VKLQADMKAYYRELADAITHATPRADAFEASAHCSDVDRTALRSRYNWQPSNLRPADDRRPDTSYLRRHRQTITEVKRKIIQKQKKSRLPETAVASLKAWWEENAAHPFPSVGWSAGNLHTVTFVRCKIPKFWC